MKTLIEPQDRPDYVCLTCNKHFTDLESYLVHIYEDLERKSSDAEDNGVGRYQ